MVAAPPPSSDRREGAPSGVGELTDLLQERILSGRLAGGSWLRQELLAAEFGVSRTPVREALRALAARGLVELHAHRGAVVRAPTARDIREAYAVRAELEGFATELAAVWACDADLDRLADAAGRFERLVASALARTPPPVNPAGTARPVDDEGPRWQEANDRFHLAILEAAGNRRLEATIEALHTSFPRILTWSALAGHSALLVENVEEHRAILRAIEDRDPAAARIGMVGHVRRAGELVARRLEELSGRDTE